MRLTIRGAQVVLPLVLFAAACSNDPAPPGGVTADEERQLNEAAMMLDANSVALANLTEEGEQP